MQRADRSMKLRVLSPAPYGGFALVDSIVVALQAVKTNAVAAPPRPTSSPAAEKPSTSAEQTIADEAK